MDVVSPSELKAFMDRNGYTVTDIVSATKIHSNTVYRYLSGKKVNQSTAEAIHRWKLARETIQAQRAYATG